MLAACLVGSAVAVVEAGWCSKKAPAMGPFFSYQTLVLRQSGGVQTSTGIRLRRKSPGVRQGFRRPRVGVLELPPNDSSKKAVVEGGGDCGVVARLRAWIGKGYWQNPTVVIF